MLDVEYLEQHTRTNVLTFKGPKRHSCFHTSKQLYLFKYYTGCPTCPPKLHYSWLCIRQTLVSKNILWSRASTNTPVSLHWHGSLQSCRSSFMTPEGILGFCVQSLQTMKTRHSEGQIPGIFMSKQHSCSDHKLTSETNNNMSDDRSPNPNSDTAESCTESQLL